MLDSGSSISIISEELVPFPVKGISVVKGVGGTQKAGKPVACSIRFNSGWNFDHPLKPMSLPDSPNLVLLGRDFMELFDKTLFDWAEGRVRIGTDWVWLADSTSDVQCKYDLASITNSDLQTLKCIVNEFVDLFARNPKAPKECVGVEHEIILSEDRVCVDKVRRIPKRDHDIIEMQVQDMLDNGIVRNSSSAYNSSPLLVEKKNDTSKRFVIDFRRLNKITEKDAYPLPNVDDLIECCQGSKVFTQLDLASGYWCIPIAEKDKHKTAFSVPRRKLELNRLPFGLVNAQASFQRMIDNVVEKMKRRGIKGVEAYVDNILLHTATMEEHIKLLTVVFHELRAHRLTLRADKCEIAFSEINFLGFCINEYTIRPCEENVVKLLKFPAPTTKKKLQQFLGLANFNRRFIRQYASVTKPLTTLLSDGTKFNWGPEQAGAFQEVKNTLAKYPDLALPNWEKPFHIGTDASGIATGAILYQINDEMKQPIYYHSKTLNKAQSKWSATERELFAVVDASRKFKVYCSGEVYFHSDHEPLKNIRQQKDPRGKIGRWLLELDALDCKTDYLPGKDNVGADCLSREIIDTPIGDSNYEDKAEEMIYSTKERILYDSAPKMKVEQDKDSHIQRTTKQLKIKSKITGGPYQRYSSGMSVSPGGLFLKGCRIVVPNQIQEQIIAD